MSKTQDNWVQIYLDSLEQMKPLPNELKELLKFKPEDLTDEEFLSGISSVKRGPHE